MEKINKILKNLMVRVNLLQEIKMNFWLIIFQTLSKSFMMPIKYKKKLVKKY